VTFDEADLTGVEWSGDGRSIVYSSDRGGGYSLWRVTLDGGTPTMIAGGAARMKHPVADRAGRRVVYENWNYEINVWQTGIAGDVARVARVADETPITRTSELWNFYPQVSPDGTRIAYVSTQSGAHELWVADRDGANARQLTHVGRGVVKTPRWSPDGQHIVYLAPGPASIDAFVITVASGAIANVTSSAANEVAPAWSHDGTRVFAGALDDTGVWNVWSVSAAASGDRRLEITNAVAAQAARDGSALYFTRPDQSGLWRRSLDGAEASDRVIDEISAGNTLGWLVAPTGVYFVEERGDAVILYRMSGDGARDEMATLTQFTWPGFSVTSDGSAVLYARWDRRESNLMSVAY
jgi:Tol biopolymer transport system component